MGAPLDSTKGGLIGEPGNAAALAEGIEQVLLDKGLRDRLSDSGRAAVNEHYSHHAMARRMVGVFTEVARNQA